MKQYDKPTVIDYGTLAELTASNGAVEMEDGLGKVLNTDGSPSSIVP
ncbi:MAG TPA: lasso RiPP family leader peptide-containing protein [Acidimicrobiales bacterium]|nr:lasso RiPP family leader peptide-containing protein [Acidimicrobiales bacterium]